MACNVNLPNFLSSVKIDVFALKHDYIVMWFVLGAVFLVILIVILAFAGGGDKEYRDYWGSKSATGEAFEAVVGRKLEALEVAGAKVLRNCYFKWGNGVTTEIDCILIFRSGLYVIECKDYSGWIFGDDSNEQWLQTLRSGRRGRCIKRRFYNPIRQNQNHINCIRQKLKGYSRVPIYNLVVFGDYCTFKKIENHSSARVIKASSLYETILQLDRATTFRLSNPDIQKIYFLLSRAVCTDSEVRQQHIYTVEKIKENKEFEKNYRGPSCPRCGAALVLRRGKYGSFYGCSRYPECTYRRKNS